MAADIPNEWLFRMMNPNLPRYKRERERERDARGVFEATAPLQLDGSGHPIPEGSGSAWKRIRDALAGWEARGLALAGRTPTAPAVPAVPPVAQTPPIAPPPVSGAPPAAAPAGPTPAAPPVVNTRATVSAATPAMGRIATAMAGPPQGPPEPVAGPPEPPPSGSLLDDLDPAIVEQLMQLSDKDRQLAFAESQRDMGAPRGFHLPSSTGGMFVMANPLEHAANAFARFRGKREADRIGQEQVEGRKRILDILRKQ